MSICDRNNALDALSKCQIVLPDSVPRSSPQFQPHQRSVCANSALPAPAERVSDMSRRSSSANQGSHVNDIWKLVRKIIYGQLVKISSMNDELAKKVT